MDLPTPPVPLDADCRQLDGFMLNVERLLASELWALSTGDELKAALGLWCRAWKQVPAGSLPDDEKVLASFSGAGKRWSKVRGMAMHGFVKCSDGRLYHPVLCEDVKRALDHRETYLKRREKDTERLRKWREKHDGNAAETRFETRIDRTGQDGTGRDSSSPVSNETSEEREGASAPKALSEVFSIDDDLVAQAARARSDAGLPPVDLRAEAGRYLIAHGDDGSVKGWLLWASRARTNGHAEPTGPPVRDRPSGPPPPLPPHLRN